MPIPESQPEDENGKERRTIYILIPIDLGIEDEESILAYRKWLEAFKDISEKKRDFIEEHINKLSEMTKDWGDKMGFEEFLIIALSWFLGTVAYNSAKFVRMGEWSFATVEGLVIAIIRAIMVEFPRVFNDFMEKMMKEGEG